MLHFAIFSLVIFAFAPFFYFAGYGVGAWLHDNRKSKPVSSEVLDHESEDEV
jgi:hypothetical protein